MALHLLYGGTFDPIHRAHLAVARAALDATGAARLDFVPAADPPHRAAPGAGFDDRVDLVAAALADEPPPATGAWGIDTREGRRGGPSFTVDTLRDWRRDADAPLGFVIGADAFLGLPAWRDWRALFGLAHLVVAQRPGSDLGALPRALAAEVAGRWTTNPADLRAAPAGRVLRLDLPLRRESATAVRQGLRDAAPPCFGPDGGESPDGAAGLPPAVAALIVARGLYGTGPRG